MKCRAMYTGIIRGSRVRPGAEFDFDGQTCPSWAIRLDEPKTVTPEPKRVHSKRLELENEN